MNAKLALDARRRKGAPRLVVSYVDGSWSDRIAARRVGVHKEGPEITLTLELAALARGQGKSSALEAMRELAEKRFSLDSLHVTRPQVVARLREELRHARNRVIRVRLRAPDIEVDYPGCAVFGPDAVTITLG